MTETERQELIERDLKLRRERRAAVESAGGVAAAMAARLAAVNSETLAAYRNLVLAESMRDPSTPADHSAVTAMGRVCAELGLEAHHVAEDVNAVREAMARQRAVTEAENTVKQCRDPQRLTKIRAGLEFFRECVQRRLDAVVKGEVLALDAERDRRESAESRLRANRDEFERLIRSSPRLLGVLDDA